MHLLRHTSTLFLPSSKSKLNTLLALPPHLRTRAFSSTPRSQNILLSTITASHDTLTAVHSLTGLPWAYSIPLFAVLLRTTLILPLSIYTRRSHITQIRLSPVLSAWKHVFRAQTMRSKSHLGPVKVQGEVLTKLRAKRGEIYKRYGCGVWKNYLSLLQIPVFLSVMEALRKMCGSNQGILGMLFGGNEVTTRAAQAGAENSSVVSLPDSGLVDGLLSSIPLETSLATEGMLWFPNLLAADPQLVLPFVLSGTILLNILGGRSKNLAAMGKWQKRITRSMTVLALCIGPLMLNVPSALLIYWITSSTTGYLQALLLDKLMPLPKPVANLEPKGKWMVALGQKPDGYVNPLLEMKDGEALSGNLKTGVKVQNLMVGPRFKPVVIQDNIPVGKGISGRGI